MNNHSSYKVSWVAYTCIFASGAASLAYELIWFRHLTLVFGASLYALSAVLCAFMMGLAAGAWVMGRILARRVDEMEPRKLIRLYGLLEGLIGLYALCFPLALNFLEALYPLILPADGQVGIGVHLLEFFLSTLLMFPATLLMGATLPLLGCLATGNQTQKVFTQVSRLYGVNTIGAVFGCLFTQFFAIRLFGVQGATGLAIGLNAVVFLVCIGRSKILYSEDSSSTPAETKKIKKKKKQEARISPAMSVLILIMFAYSGMVSLSSEILWTRILVFPLGSTLYSFALILATFLLGIAIGSLTANKLLGRSNWILKFVFIEIGIGIFCIAILPMLSNLTEWTSLADQYFYSLDPSAGKTFLIRSMFAFGLMFLPTFGFGLLFPLANQIYSYRFEGVGDGVGKVLGNTYSINTVGAVLGTVLTPFVFIPLFGIRLSLYGLYAVLILFGLYILGRIRELKPLSMAMVLGGVLFSLIMGKEIFVPEIETQQAGQGNFARLEVNVPADRIRLLDYKEGEYSTISVVEDKVSWARTIYLDGFSTATVSSGFSGSTYMQAMGFVPMVLHPAPKKKVLVIGFGTGNTIGTASMFPGAEVHGVEIDKNVLTFSKWFASWNYDVLNRPNTKMIIQDGRAFLKWSQSKYDVIIMEPMSPLQAGVVNLYSKEFYELALSRLKEDGLLVQWLPLHLVGPEDARSITHTFRQVFPEFSVWNSFLTRIVLLVGSRNSISLDKNYFETLMDNSEINKIANEMKVNSFLDFTDFFVTEGKSLSPFLEGAGEITDDSPLLEFSSVSLLPPLQWETDESFLNLLRPRLDQFPRVEGMSAQELEVLRKSYEIRTAQRFSLFVRRYQGPGENAFASRNYLGGLEALRKYFDSNKGVKISLQDAKWNE
jgi:spermidine synthase